jgi:hypothetical protein
LLNARRRRLRRRSTARQERRDWVLVVAFGACLLAGVLSVGWSLQGSLWFTDVGQAALESRQARLQPEVEAELEASVGSVDLHSVDDVGLTNAVYGPLLEHAPRGRKAFYLSGHVLGCFAQEPAPTIYLNRDALLRVADRYDGDDEDLVDAILVHELVHAHEARIAKAVLGGSLHAWTEAARGPSLDASLCRSAVLEGYAQHVTFQVGARLGLLDVLRWRESHFDLIAAQTTSSHLRVAKVEHDLVYVEGRTFVAAVAEALGEDPLPTLLQRPPATRHELRDPSLYLSRLNAAR